YLASGLPYSGAGGAIRIAEKTESPWTIGPASGTVSISPRAVSSSLGYTARVASNRTTQGAEDREQAYNSVRYRPSELDCTSALIPFVANRYVARSLAGANSMTASSRPQFSCTWISFGTPQCAMKWPVTACFWDVSDISYPSEYFSVPNQERAL